MFWTSNLEKKLKAVERELEQLRNEHRTRSEFLSNHGDVVRTQQALIYMEQLCNQLDAGSIGVNREAGRKVIHDIKTEIRNALRLVARRESEYDFPGHEINATDIEMQILEKAKLKDK